MTLHLDLAVAGWLAVAGLAGLAVGIEREWSGHASGPAARFAGARAFLLLGLLGGLAGWLIEGGLAPLGALLLAGGSALVVVAYAMAARRGAESIEATTEVAALVVLALGAVSGLGFPLLASAVASLMVLALAEKTRIHAAIARLGEPELGAALRFAVLALVILPILPPGPYGPFGSIRPRALWAVVLLFSGLHFVGYLSRRALGVKRGYALTGLVGGIVSSTAVTFEFARHSRHEPGVERPLAAGVVGACTVLVLKEALLGAVLNPTLGSALVGYLAPVILTGAGAFAFAFLGRGADVHADPASKERNPLGFGVALQMAVGFQLVLFVLPLVGQLWGPSGVIASAALLGVADMDALTYAMTRLGTSPEAAALGAQGIAVGMLATTGVKLAITLWLGGAGFRRLAGAGLVALAVGSGIGLWLGR